MTSAPSTATPKPWTWPGRPWSTRARPCGGAQVLAWAELPALAASAASTAPMLFGSSARRRTKWPPTPSAASPQVRLRRGRAHLHIAEASLCSAHGAGPPARGGVTRRNQHPAASWGSGDPASRRPRQQAGRLRRRRARHAYWCHPRRRSRRPADCGSAASTRPGPHRDDRRGGPEPGRAVTRAPAAQPRRPDQRRAQRPVTTRRHVTQSAKPWSPPTATRTLWSASP